MTTLPTLGVVTAIGRPEYEYFRAAAQSVSELATLVSTQWCIAIAGPAVDGDLVTETAHGSGAEVMIVSCKERHAAGPARNIAMREIDAPYLVTLDADDTLHSPGVRELLDGLARHPEAAWAAGRCHHVDPEGKLLWEGPDDPFEPGLIATSDTFWHAKCRTGMLPFICTATVAETDAIRHVGGWPEPARLRADDTALWSVLSTQFVGLWVPTRVYHYRRHGASTTSQPGFRDIDERLDQTARMVARGTTKNYD